ncbi:hypothetical protein SNOG_11553 [Parastagonospora nodorum SN15]|uniref:Uncharacterized protein n=2 Tax=Phaeosphaeria nodorum (strain SN15 / ATCC MYA-4574 / FGSC 10173) TaxID=321614 RepID=Q0U9L1_PHANO|nr:hypothetical protein SNOG_11553 [Parastagonospora nodorum SN15]EAT81261.1 hypothetical protein SNOG_11553 [Parastagonospora nodorum SN15]
MSLGTISPPFIYESGSHRKLADTGLQGHRCSSEARFLKLTLEREQVQKEIVTLRKQHKEALLLDAQRRCRIFATRFTNTLPLELREMVYTELWSGQKHRHDYPSEGEGITADPNYKSDPLKSVKRDKLWRLNCKGDSYHFHLGIRPADHVRCLDLFVRATYANDLANEYYDDDGYGPPAPTEYNLEQDKYRVIAMESLLTLTHWLRPLLDIRVKKDFHLRIFFKDGREHQKLEAFRPVVRTFVDAGAHFALLSPVPGMDEHQNVLNYFEMGLQDWQNEWAAIAEARRLEQLESMRKSRMRYANEALGDDTEIDILILMLRSRVQNDRDVRRLVELVARGEANERQLYEFGHLMNDLEWDAFASHLPDDYSEGTATS